MSENRKNEINMPSSENTLAFNINRFLSVNFRTLTAYMAEFVISKRIKLTANNAMKKSIKYSISIQSPRIAYNALLFFCNFIQTDKIHTFSFRFFKMNLFGINNQIRVEVIVSFDKTKYSEFAESYGFVGFMCRIGICENICFTIWYCHKKTCSPVFLSLIL